MKEYLRTILREALGHFNLDTIPEIEIEKPNVEEHGDAATNIAMQLAQPLGDNPRNIAEQIVKHLEIDENKVESVEVAGPGFINFHFARNYLYRSLETILSQKSSYGQSRQNEGQHIQIEFVSANPTGPLTIGHGRNAVLGDTIARLLEWTGARVDREYYFNDAGRQMRLLGESVKARYHELLGQDIPFPEEGYEGQYIRDIAQSIYEAEGDELLNGDLSTFQEIAESYIFNEIKTTLERMNIRMDSFFNEHTLYEDGSIDNVVKRLKEKDLAYESDGATWFKTSEFDKEKDTVLVKSSGEPTYRLPDIAYHINKLERGYDRCIDIFGADHIDTYPDVLAAVRALDYDTSKFDVLVYQFVTLVKDGKPFKMSTRKANFITLDELMDEVGSDVTRFYFLMRSPNTHLEFDIAQAKEESENNPVFYLQYAHARIQSILRKVEQHYDFSDRDETDYTVLTHNAEISLIKALHDFPEVIVSAADHTEPHRLINYLYDLAGDFTTFYHECRILDQPDRLARARTKLARAAAITLANGLQILGINAPDEM